MIRHFLHGLAGVILSSTFSMASMGMDMEEIDFKSDENSPLIRKQPVHDMIYDNKTSTSNRKIYDQNTKSYKTGKALSCALEHLCYPRVRCNEVTPGLYVTPGCFMALFLEGIPGLVSCCHPVSANVFVAGGIVSGICACILPAWVIGGSITACCVTSCHEKGHGCDNCVAPIYHIKYRKEIKKSLRKLQNQIHQWDQLSLYTESTSKMSDLFAQYISQNYGVSLEWKVNSFDMQIKSLKGAFYYDGRRKQFFEFLGIPKETKIAQLSEQTLKEKVTEYLHKNPQMGKENVKENSDDDVTSVLKAFIHQNSNMDTSCIIKDYQSHCKRNYYSIEPLEEQLCYQLETDLSPVKTLKNAFFNDPTTHELQYRYHLHQELNVLKKTIDQWNEYKTSLEEKSRQVIEAFCRYIEKEHNCKLIWSDLTVMEPLELSLYKTFRGFKESTVAQVILKGFYKDEHTEVLLPKGFDVFKFFQKAQR